MRDLNILNRASFEEKKLQLTCTVKPGQQEKIVATFKSGQVFCLQEISWRYGVENVQDNYGWPKTPLLINISGILNDRIETPYKLSPPKLLAEQIEIEAFNPSGVNVKLYYTLDGILVTPNENESLSYKEILGYILLDNNQKGLLALSEVNASKQSLEETILTSILNGKLSLDKLPLLQQTMGFLPINKEDDALVDKLVARAYQSKSKEPIADSESLISLMIGDLVTFQPAQSQIKIDVELIQELAKYLISKKWNR